jgi:hypothetical protein
MGLEHTIPVYVQVKPVHAIDGAATVITIISSAA